MTQLKPCLIIAEAGVNHNGSIEMAMRLVDAAADAGADVIKFQTFRAADLASALAPKAPYQQRLTDETESQFDMLRRLELDLDAHLAIIERCTQRGIEFASSPFSTKSLQLLSGRLGVRRIKLGSGELTNAPLLVAAGRTGLPVILSTGMATLPEIGDALSALAFGHFEKSAIPSRASLAAIANTGEMLAALQERVTLLHCTTEYPAPLSEVNLAAMQTMRMRFGLPVGYSDHTEGIAISIAAAALGAVMLEKHITLDRNLPGPDHKASLEPAEFAVLVKGVRSVEIARGNGEKQPQPSEIPNIEAARKSIVVERPLQAGQVITADHIAVKRPGNGKSPFEYWDVIGTRAARAYRPGELL